MTPSPAIGCIRVSTDQQQDRYGPDRQRRDIEREAAYAGLDVVGWHEEAVSGAKIERYNENAYYEQARAQPGLAFIFSASSRVGRHVEIIVGIARNLLKMGSPVFVAGIGDLRRPRNWKEFLRDSVDAENDYSNIIRQLTDGKREKAQSGGWAQGRPPFGYRLVRDERGVSGTLDIVPNAAAAVHRVFQLYAEHGGNALTARQANLEGLRTGADKHWTESGVAALIRNSRYTGRAEFYGHTVTYPAIIEPELWEAVQAQIRHRRKGERTAHGPRLLTGIARCAVCGGGMTYHISTGGGRGGGRYEYYRCWRSGRVEATTGTHCTHGTYYRRTTLDDATWAAVTDLLTQPEQVLALLSRDVPPPTHGPRLAQIGQEMADLLTRATRYNLPDDVVTAALEPLQRERERLEREQAQVLAPQVPPALLDACQRMAVQMRTLPREQWRSVLDDLRVRVEVGPGGTVSVTDFSVPVA